MSATRTEVHRYRDLPAILLRGQRLRRSWPHRPGAIQLQVGLEPLRRITWTVSTWESRADLDRFLRSQEHLDALRPFRKRMSVAGVSWDADAAVFNGREAWRDARHRLKPARTDERKGLALESRLMAWTYRLGDLIQHPAAPATATQPADVNDLGSLAETRQAIVVTFRSSGAGVATPVNVALAGERLYFRSEPHVGKIGRLRRDPRLHLSACTYRGRPTGPIVAAVGRVLDDPAEIASAHAALERNWDPLTKQHERFCDRIGVPAVYVEVTAGRGHDQHAS